MKKTILNTALGLVMGAVSLQASAASVSNGDLLLITSGVTTTTDNAIYVSSGSYFGMDFNADSKIARTEKFAILVGSNGGITIGSTSPFTSMYPTNLGLIDKWYFNGSQGQDWLDGTAITGSTTAGLDMGGWTVHWGASDGTAVNPPMTGGAWQPLNCTSLGCSGTFTNGNAHFTWNGLNGDAYVLDYTATVPLGDPSGFGGTLYFLHLTGTVSTVPVPAAAWLFGSGLLGLVGMSRHKKVA